MRNVLPKEVWGDIQRHVGQKLRDSDVVYQESGGNEDSVTGDLFGNLRKRSTRIRTAQGNWRWSIRYKKFGSGGEKSQESVSGADGIVQFELYGPERGEMSAKGILFQAKKGTNTDRAALYQQLERMEALVPNGGAVFEYSPEAFRAVPSSVTLRDVDSPRAFPNLPFAPLDTFLTEEFIGCHVGAMNLYYDFERHVLVVPTENDAVRLYNEVLKHKLVIEVHAPAPSVPAAIR